MSDATLSTGSLGLLLKRAQHAFRTRVDDALRPLGINAPKYAVLTAVHAETGISNADLARIAFVTPQTMQGILANLERTGLITRTPHPEHGRILRTELTGLGHRKLRQAQQHVQDIEQRLIDAVGAENAADVARMLRQCAEALASE